MARVNKYKESSAGIAERLSAKRPADSVTRDLVKDLEAQPDTPGPENGAAIYTASPEQIGDLFVPYRDERLRLKPLTGERYERLKESIAMDGVMMPVTCVPGPDGKYMILCGHNRARAAKELSVPLPYMVKTGLTDEQMDRICTDSNLLNRQLEDYKPSQLAYALKVKRDAESHQGRKLDPGEIIEESSDTGYKLGKVQMARYIKLNSLIPSLLSLVDDGKITIKTGYQAAFFPSAAQEIILDYVGELRTERPLQQLRQEIQNEGITEDADACTYVARRLPELAVRTKQKHVTDYRNLKPYIPDHIKPAEVESYIIRALEAYREQEE